MLTQVEREVLVEAVEKAGIDPLMTKARSETLDELAGWFNLAANLAVLGPGIKKLAQQETLEEAIAIFPFVPKAPGLVSLGITFFSKLEDAIAEITEAVTAGEIGSIGTAKDFARQALSELSKISTKTRQSYMLSAEGRALINAENLLQLIIDLVI